MLMPGFSSSRVPVQVRLFIAVAVTLALAPLLLPTINTAIAESRHRPSCLRLIVSETLIGALIGLIGRIFFMALQFMASCRPVHRLQPDAGHADRGHRAAAGAGDVHHADGDRAAVPHRPALGGAARAAGVLFRAARQRADRHRISASRRLADAFSRRFILALQISSPFIVYALIINLMVGIANKLVPQIPVYFISMPFVLAGGLLLLYFTIGEALRLFMAGFIAWLATG